MAEPKNEDFLDDIEQAEAEELAQELSDITDEQAELDSLRAERDEYRDKFMRALADAENTRKRGKRPAARPNNTAARNWRAICCRFTIT